MTLGSISCAKHLGGLSSIRLLSASEIGSLSYDSAERCFSSLLPIDGGELRDVAFAEGSARLEEVVEPETPDEEIPDEETPTNPKPEKPSKPGQNSKPDKDNKPGQNHKPGWNDKHHSNNKKPGRR